MNTTLLKKIASIGLVAMMSGCLVADPAALKLITENTAVVAEAATASGPCGTDLSWTLSGDTLTISGTGTAMANYNSTSNKAPWKTYASQIKKVILPKTLKSIGEYAFYNMSALEYVYTKDGNMNAPVFPDVTYIGRYAFADCYNFRGNTENGKMTLGYGTASVKQDGNIRVCDSAFQNCDKVRFLYVNFASMYVENWGFYNMNMLSSVNTPDTTLELCNRAFYYCSSLATVNYKPSVKKIHNQAFAGTSYYNTKCTNTQVYGQNYSTAKQMTGKQLIVNFFVDMTKVNTGFGDGGYTKWGSASTVFPLASNEVAAKAKNTASGYSQYYAFDKNNMTYNHVYSWNAKKSSTKTDNTVVSLNKLDYTTLRDQTKISKNIVDNSESSGFYGSNVTSDAIQQRLTQVRDAANDLASQINGYSTKSLTFQMHPETNFYLTYDSFDWTTTKMTFDGKTYDVMGGYYSSITDPIDRGTKLDLTSDNPIFASLKKASQQHTGGVTQTIDLFTSSGSSLSSYTNYLKQHYGVEGVVYLFHFNGSGRTTTRQNTEKSHGGTEEFVFTFSDTGAISGATMIEHEMCHLYGAQDYYNQNALSASEARYCQTNFSTDIMMSKPSTVIGPATAYSIGWLDRLDSTIFNNAFKSLKKN